MAYSNPAEQREYQRQWRAARRQEALDNRGNACQKCGSSDDLEFHHRDKTKKVCHKVYSWRKDRIAAELAKCDLLCQKCHLRETFVERGWGNYFHGTLTCYQKTKCRCLDCRKANAKAQLLNKYARQRLKEATSDAGAAPAISTITTHGDVTVSTGL